MARSVALGFAVLLALFEIGTCLRCYQCNSQSDRDCLDDTFFNPNSHLVDCSAPESMSYNRQYLRTILPPHLVESVAGAPRTCAKIVTQTGTTVRTCLDVNPSDPRQTCYALERANSDYPNNPNNVRHCSVCDRDLCNSSGAITASIPLAFLAIAASYLFYKQ